MQGPVTSLGGDSGNVSERTQPTVGVLLGHCVQRGALSHWGSLGASIEGAPGVLTQSKDMGQPSSHFLSILA